MGSLSSISALGRERSQALVWENESTPERPQVVSQGLAIAQPLKRDSLVERLPIASAVWIVQRFAVRWRCERQE